MITAEHSDLCTTTKARTTVGPLTVGTYGLYGEHQIINYTEQPLYVVDSHNQHVLLTPQYQYTTSKRVDIVWRTVVGSRSFDPRTNAETTKAQHYEMTIPLERVLRVSPVYVQQLNVVLCTEEHLRDVFHPCSPEYKHSKWKELHDDVIQNATHAPFMVIANDPTGTIRELWMYVHNKLVAAKVTRFQDEPDTVTIAYRDKTSVTVEYDIHTTTFSELKAANKQSGLVWDFAGITFSAHRDLLEYELDVREQKHAQETISITDLQAHLDRARELAEADIRRATEENAALKKRIAVLEQLRNAAYSDRAADIELGKLELESKKLNTAKQDLHRVSSIEQLKLRKEQVATWHTAVKALAAVVPIALGLAKWYYSSKPA